MIDHRLIKTANCVHTFDLSEKGAKGGFPDYDELEMTFRKGYRNWVSFTCLRK
jgi:hypothetical protein